MVFSTLSLAVNSLLLSDWTVVASVNVSLPGRPLLLLFTKHTEELRNKDDLLKGFKKQIRVEK